ncbi:hypothetical protein D5S17_29685 [Pseudonocardiaceae bacterium YIM PH 21723]|nr:hypothetical protein D5S17_29685 [Pseudonocardiaceae bacterium YIM PH 21723]
MDQFLGIYLNDQLALGVGWRELAGRAARNQGTPADEPLRRVAACIAADVDTLRRLMRRLNIRPSPLKQGLAVLGERLGRWKPNGRLRSYSPLSRFEELELLTVGLEARKQLWVTLSDQADLATRFPDIDFDVLTERAGRLRAELDPLRIEAALDAFKPVVNETEGVGTCER